VKEKPKHPKKKDKHNKREKGEGQEMEQFNRRKMRKKIMRNKKDKPLQWRKELSFLFLSIAKPLKWSF
jgi:hypothetical protein